MAAANRDLFVSGWSRASSRKITGSAQRAPLGSPGIYFQTMLQAGTAGAQRDGRKDAGIHENRGAMGIEPG